MVTQLRMHLTTMLPTFRANWNGSFGSTTASRSGTLANVKGSFTAAPGSVLQKPQSPVREFVFERNGAETYFGRAINGER